MLLNIPADQWSFLPTVPQRKCHLELVNTEAKTHPRASTSESLMEARFHRTLNVPQSSSVQSLSHVQLFATPWIAARQASLSITNSRSSHRLTSIESAMPSSHLILCHPLLLPSVFPSIRVFSNESALCIRWPNYWSVSFSISPYNEYSGLISFRIDWFDLLSVQETLKSPPSPKFKSISFLVLSFLYRPALTTIHDAKNHSFD